MKNKIKQNIVICMLLTLILGLWSMKSNAQSTAATNVCNVNNFLGWTTSCDLPFKINGTQYMTLRTTGDLNLNVSTTGYQIGGNNILWHNGNTADIFVGVSAGNATMTGHNNTTGNSNTYLGYQADGATNALSNSSAIGNSASVCASDEMVFGNSSVTRWGFGVCPASGHAIEVGTSTSNGNGAYLTSGGAWTGASSRAKKEDFQKQDINVMLDKVRQMEVTKWKYKGTENEYHYGPMAEDFYQLFNVGDGKSISDMDKTGVLFLAVQALDASNRELTAKLTALQDQVNGCCNTQQGNSSDGARATAVDVALSSNSIVLDQNQPNPFKEQTTISNFIPH